MQEGVEAGKTLAAAAGWEHRGRMSVTCGVVRCKVHVPQEGLLCWAEACSSRAQAAVRPGSAVQGAAAESIWHHLLGGGLGGGELHHTALSNSARMQWELSCIHS